MSLELEEDPLDPLARRLFAAFADSFSIDVREGTWDLLTPEDKNHWRWVAREAEKIIQERCQEVTREAEGRR